MDEFKNEHDFAEHRNRVGGLLLLPKSFNASYVLCLKAAAVRRMFGSAGRRGRVDDAG